MLLWHIHSILGRELDVTTSMLRQAFDKNVRNVNNLSIMQTMLMLELKPRGTLQCEVIKRVIGITDEEMRNAVLSLSEQGYITTLVLNDGEAITITDSGKSLFEQIQQAITDTEAQMLVGLSEEDKRLLFKILRDIQANCITATLQPSDRR